MANIEPTQNGFTVTWSEEDKLTIQQILAGNQTFMSLYHGLAIKPKTNWWNVLGIVIIIIQIFVINYLLFF